MIMAVYGTLKQGFGNNHLLERAKYLGEAFTTPEYTMYSLGGFPTIVKNGNTSIKIEVYEVEDPTAINRLEGFTGEKNSPSNWYNTETIATPYGDAEMFVFDKPPQRHINIVESGVWE